MLVLMQTMYYGMITMVVQLQEVLLVVDLMELNGTLIEVSILEVVVLVHTT